jgi:hypothetical protein
MPTKGMEGPTKVASFAADTKNWVTSMNNLGYILGCLAFVGLIAGVGVARIRRRKTPSRANYKVGAARNTISVVNVGTKLHNAIVSEPQSCVNGPVEDESERLSDDEESDVEWDPSADGGRGRDPPALRTINSPSFKKYLYEGMTESFTDGTTEIDFDMSISAPCYSPF